MPWFGWGSDSMGRPVLSLLLWVARRRNEDGGLKQTLTKEKRTMKMTEKIQQARACKMILDTQPNDVFCQHKAPLLADAIAGAERSMSELTVWDAKWRAERQDANKSLDTLSERALYYGELLKMELSHLDTVQSLDRPRNMIEKELYADSVIEVIADNPDLYFAVPALDELLPLEEAFDKEQREADDMKEGYHNAIQARNEVFSQLERLVSETKRFTRRVFGRESRQFQSIKNTLFTRPNTSQQVNEDIPPSDTPQTSVDVQNTTTNS